ncbi:MAG TPA: hypothetical protein VEF91_02960, partial [Verrucomicrobiae bacterium]|nr:hypothetical protein [Verrucomicrobiae bacterium]
KSVCTCIPLYDYLRLFAIICDYLRFNLQTIQALIQKINLKQTEQNQEEKIFAGSALLNKFQCVRLTIFGTQSSAQQATDI